MVVLEAYHPICIFIHRHRAGDQTSGPNTLGLDCLVASSVSGLPKAVAMLSCTLAPSLRVRIGVATISVSLLYDPFDPSQSMQT